MTTPGPGSPAPPTAEDLIALLDLRERIEDYFETAGQAWLDRQIATDGDFRNVINKSGYMVEFDRDHLTYAYYADAWESRNSHPTYAKIRLGELVPEYGDARTVLKALGAT